MLPTHILEELDRLVHLFFVVLHAWYVSLQLQQGRCDMLEASSPEAYEAGDEDGRIGVLIELGNLVEVLCGLAGIASEQRCTA